GHTASVADDGVQERRQLEWLMLHDPATGKIPAHIRQNELAFAAMLPNDGTLDASMKTTNVSWQSRGPWNVGGRTRAFALDVTNDNFLIAGATSGGMWRSADGGQSWVPTTPPTSHKSVSCVSQDVRAGKQNVWYYGTGEGYGASASATGAYYLGNGIYKSVDSGKTWSVLPSTTSPSLTTFDTWADITWNIATNPANDTQDMVMVAAYGGIYKSLDGGATWSVAKGSNATVSYFTDIAISATGVIYVTLSSDGPQKGIYRSLDGTNFTDITPANFPAVYDRIKIGISPSDENQVYFLGHTPGFGQPDTSYQGEVEWNSLWKYTYLTGDGAGANGNWDDRSLNLPTTGGPFDKFTTQGSYNIVVKVKPDDPNTVYIGGTNLYRSTNGFADDAQTTFIGGYIQGASLPVVHHYPDHHPDQHELVFLSSNPNRMISANDGGVFITDDNMAASVDWTSLNNGYLTTQFYTCALDHAASDNVIIGGAQDNGSWYINSANSTDPWVTPRGGDGSWCAIADNKAAFYLSIQNGKMMKAKLNTAGGVDSFARIDPIGAKNYLFINPYALDPNNNNIMYLAGGKHLWRNNDLSGIPYASNWDSITTNWFQYPDSVPTAGARITAIAVSKTPANRVYYGTSSRRLYRVENANTNNPQITDITALTGSAPFPTGYISSIAIDPDNSDKLMVTFSNYGVYSIFYSDNAGATWAKAGGNLEANNAGSGNGPSVRWARIMNVNGGTVYLVGTSVGLFATTALNGFGTVWVQQGASSIGNSVVNMIDSRSTDGLVVVATHSHGIFSGNITSINDITGIAELQLGAPLITAYPVPFRSETTIRLELTKTEQISLTVYDQQGRLVATLAQGKEMAGRKEYNFSAALLPAGMYLVVAKTAGGVRSMKVMKE
ncbi:MAG: T9SS type A sorting domain-containing protein, partial [Sphingobacteriales bacterium]